METSRLPRLYAGLEGGIALAALAFPFALELLTPLFSRLYGASGLALTLVRVVTAATFLLVPTTLMGATLPTLTALRERMAKKGRGVARSAALLYAANTFGAVVGSLTTGVILLYWLGLRTTTLLAVGLNALAALIVLTLRSESAPAPERESGEHAGRVGLAVIALSGFAALASEVAWTRAIVLLIGPTTYGFSFIVSAVIFGIALGSAVASKWARASTARRHLALVQLAAAITSVALIQILGSLTLPVGELVRTNANDMTRLLGLELAWVFGLLVPPSVLFGASFPLAVAVVAGTDASDSPANVTGRTYVANTIGAVLGSLVTGFWVLPAFGAETALYLAAAAHVVAAGLVVIAQAGARRWAYAAASVVSFAVVYLTLPKWDRELMSGGLYKVAPYLEEGEFLDFLRRGELLYYGEDKVATVTVKEVGRRLSLAVDGKVDATNAEDMLTQRMLAHVPLLLHPDPKDVLVIGFGSGVTAGSALTHDVTSVEAVEISSDVAAASALFSKVNHEPESDPRFTLHHADGRNHLLLRDAPYDVIISEPSNPWMAGVSGLFTREFFQLARERLSENGLFCQWAHIYNLSEEDLMTIVGSFTDVFEQTSLFVLSEADVLLVGARNDIAPTPRRASGRVLADLNDVGVAASNVLRAFPVAKMPALSAWSRDAARHTDDRPVLEFRAARAMHEDTGLENRDALLELTDDGPPLGPDELQARASMLEAAESFHWAFELYEASRDYDGMVRTAIALGDPARAEARLKALALEAGGVEVHAALGLLYKNVGALDAAVESLSRAIELDPVRRATLLLAAEVAGDRDELAVMAGIARDILSRDPLDAEAAALLGEVTLRSGDATLASRQAGAILDQRPDEPRALQVLAIAQASLGQHDAARDAFEKLEVLEPDAFIHLNNRGRLELEAGDIERAMELFERAVDLNPRNLVGYEGLEQSAQAAGDELRLERARSMLAFLRRE